MDENQKLKLFSKSIPDFKDKNIAHQFICPICNAKTYAIRSDIDGHVYAFCFNCRISLVK